MLPKVLFRLRSLVLAFVLVLGMLIFNPFATTSALAGDNYSAETDTYQETRNPNRVDTTREELAKSKLSTSAEEETEGQSIYDTVVDRVNKQRDTSIPGSSNKKTRSEP